MADYCGLIFFDSQKKKIFQFTFFDTPQNEIESDNKEFIYANKFIKTIRDLSNNQQYVFYEINNNNIEETGLINISEDKKGYVLFEIDDLLYKKIPQDVVELYIKNVLTQYQDPSIESVSFLWAFYEYRNEDVSCIFYRIDNKPELNIIRYKNISCEWMIGNYGINDVKENK